MYPQSGTSTYTYIVVSATIPSSSLTILMTPTMIVMHVTQIECINIKLLVTWIFAKCARTLTSCQCKQTHDHVACVLFKPLIWRRLHTTNNHRNVCVILTTYMHHQCHAMHGQTSSATVTAFVGKASSGLLQHVIPMFLCCTCIGAVSCACMMMNTLDFAVVVTCGLATYMKSLLFRLMLESISGGWIR